jgi:hypothetical protein
VTAVIAALTLVAWRMESRGPELSVNRLDLSFGDITLLGNSDVVISPDGNMIALAGTRNGEQAIYLRRLNGDPGFVKVAGTEGAEGSPGFSPDNQWLLFRRQPDASLIRVAVSGGGGMRLAQVSQQSFPFAHWGTDSLVLYNGGASVGPIVMRAVGGDPDTVGLVGAGRVSYLLPDGSGFLFNRSISLWLHDFRTDSSIRLLPFAAMASYVPTGHLLYVAEAGGLFAVPFDLRTHRITGTPVKVAERVAANVQQRGYSVSNDGTLVYNDGPESALFAGWPVRRV